MNSIQVLTDKLPKNGYHLICEYYNTNKSVDAMPLQKANVCEGGFEIPLNESELAIIRRRYDILDQNQKVRQLRWSLGWLISMGHNGLFKEEEELLLKSLKHVLGEDKVDYKPYIYNKTWWESQLD